MKQITTVLLDILNIVASGEGALISTSITKKSKDLSSDIPTGEVAEGKARVVINCTGFAGTSMAVDIVAIIDGVDVIIDSFTDLTAIGQETLIIECCPTNLKVVYTATTITDFDAKVFCVRF